MRRRTPTTPNKDHRPSVKEQQLIRDALHMAHIQSLTDEIEDALVLRDRATSTEASDPFAHVRRAIDAKNATEPPPTHEFLTTEMPDKSTHDDPYGHIERASGDDANDPPTEN